MFAARRLAADPVVVLAAARSPRRTGSWPASRSPTGRARPATPRRHWSRVRPAVARARPARAVARAGRREPAGPAGARRRRPRRSRDRPGRATGEGAGTVTAAFARRLDRLDEACRTALLVAAVCAGDLPVTTRACSALGRRRRCAGRGGGRRAGVVRGRPGRLPAPAGAGGGYSRAGARERRAAHRAVADALAEATRTVGPGTWPRPSGSRTRRCPTCWPTPPSGLGADGVLRGVGGLRAFRPAHPGPERAGRPAAVGGRGRLVGRADRAGARPARGPRA